MQQQRINDIQAKLMNSSQAIAIPSTDPYQAQFTQSAYINSPPKIAQSRNSLSQKKT